MKLKNTFHNTETNVNRTLAELVEMQLDYDAQRSTPEDLRYIKRIERKLCGIAGCTCSDNVFGTRD